MSVGLQGLGAARTKDQLVNALWDFRDSAYDSPDTWRAFDAEAFWQGLAASLEDGPTADETHVDVLVLAEAMIVAVQGALRNRN